MPVPLSAFTVCSMPAVEPPIISGLPLMPRNSRSPFFARILIKRSSLAMISVETWRTAPLSLRETSRALAGGLQEPVQRAAVREAGRAVVQRFDAKDGEIRVVAAFQYGLVALRAVAGKHRFARLAEHVLRCDQVAGIAALAQKALAVLGALDEHGLRTRLAGEQQQGQYQGQDRVRCPHRSCL